MILFSQLIFIWLVGAWLIVKYNIEIFTQLPQATFFTTLMLWFSSFFQLPVAIIFIILNYRKRRAWLLPFAMGMLFVYMLVFLLQILSNQLLPNWFTWFFGEQSFVAIPAVTATILFFYLSLESQITKKFFFFVSFLIAFSLVYLGIYFPIDVWHGLMIAFIAMSFVAKIIEKQSWFFIFQNTLIESFLLNIIGFVIVLYFMFFSHGAKVFLIKELVYLFWIFFFYFAVRLVLEAFILVKRKRTLYVSKA